MGYETHAAGLPGGALRDSSDHAQWRHGRDAQRGFHVGRYLQPPPMLFTRDGHNVFLGDLYRGRPAFLLCSGPSLTSLDLSSLAARGILTCAVNNAATVYRPQLWVSVDDPAHFADAIWRDAGIIKFVPLSHMEKHFAVRQACGRLVESCERVGNMPAVLGYRRNEDSSFRAKLISRSAIRCTRPNYLQAAEQLLRSGVDCACPDMHLVGESSAVWRVPEANLAAAMVERNRIAYCSAFARDWWLRLAGFDEAMGNWQDYEFWLRMLRAGANFKRLPGAHFFYRRHGPSKSLRPAVDRDRAAGLWQYLRSKHPELPRLGAGRRFA